MSLNWNICEPKVFVKIAVYYYLPMSLGHYNSIAPLSSQSLTPFIFIIQDLSLSVITPHRLVTPLISFFFPLFLFFLRFIFLSFCIFFYFVFIAFPLLLLFIIMFANLWFFEYTRTSWCKRNLPKLPYLWEVSPLPSPHLSPLPFWFMSLSLLSPRFLFPSSLSLRPSPSPPPPLPPFFFNININLFSGYRLAQNCSKQWNKRPLSIFPLLLSPPLTSSPTPPLLLFSSLLFLLSNVCCLITIDESDRLYPSHLPSPLSFVFMRHPLSPFVSHNQRDRE